MYCLQTLALKRWTWLYNAGNYKFVTEYINKVMQLFHLKDT